MSALVRLLTTRDAVVVGLGSMVGAGVFAVWAPAARAVEPAGAGAGLLVALVLAAAVAYANATSTGQLAAQFPASGGTYVYGRERLGPWWGYVAGWGFVVGKTASCAAMALTVAAYSVPPAWQRPTAAAAVVALTTVNSCGVTRTVRFARWIVGYVLLVLSVWAVVALGNGAPDWSQVLGAGGAARPEGDAAGGLAVQYGVLQATGLLFFAFAGYARVATMGEEVRDPVRVIPRAIRTALVTAVVVYAGVALVLLAVLGLTDIAASSAPLTQAVDPAWAGVLVRAGAAAASLGALLALMAGVGRTAMAMAREGDLPRWLAATHPHRHVPHHAEVALAATVVAIVLGVNLCGAIGFSSFGVLTYYAIANAAAWTQDAEHRRHPRWLQVAGLVGCVALCATLPLTSVLIGVAVIGVGLAVRARRLARGSRT